MSGYLGVGAHETMIESRSVAYVHMLRQDTTSVMVPTFIKHREDEKVRLADGKMQATDMGN